MTGAKGGTGMSFRSDRFYCPERTHFVPDGKPVEVGSLVQTKDGFGGGVRELKVFDLDPLKCPLALFVGSSDTHGCWIPVASLTSGDWAPIESCEDGGQI